MLGAVDSFDDPKFGIYRFNVLTFANREDQQTAV